MKITNMDMIKVRYLLEQYRKGNFNENTNIDYNTIKTLKQLLGTTYFTNYELSFVNRYIIGNNSLLTYRNEKNENVMCILRYTISQFKIQLLEYYRTKIDYFKDLVYDNIIILNRQNVEYDDRYLQLIPYMIIKRGNEFILLEKKRGDNRLINRLDFPAGHCSEGSIEDSIYRELKEELSITKIKSKSFIGFIPIDSDKFSVSHYHLGLIYVIDLYDDSTIHNNEPDKHDLVYFKYKDIINNLEFNRIDFRKFSDWCTYSLLKYNEIYEV